MKEWLLGIDLVAAMGPFLIKSGPLVKIPLVLLFLSSPYLFPLLFAFYHYFFT